MSKVDLHVHSKYSEELSEQFLRSMGAAESYTDPEEIYRKARERGMTFVTVTDHNRIEGALRLKENHPDTVFTGLEATAYFPEDGCNIHMLVYGLDARQFAEIQKLRTNIYELRGYLRSENLAHSVAHATYSRTNKLTVEKLEKLILLFDVFEGINGGSSRTNNDTWMRVLRSLTPARIEDLRRKHRIEPFSDSPWIKGFTGGSDDHGGIFMGRTCTVSDATTVEEFLDSLRSKSTDAMGRHSDFQSLAFTLYKVAYDFSRNRTKGSPASFLGKISDMVFDSKSLRLRDKLALRHVRNRSRRRSDHIQEQLFKMIDTLREDPSMQIEDRLDVAYDTIASVSDEYLKLLFSSFSPSIRKGDVPSIVRNFSSSLSGIFLSLPFLATFRYMSKGRMLAQELLGRFSLGKSADRKKVLWFTDTLNEVSGSSLSVRDIAWVANLKNKNLKVVSALSDAEKDGEVPPNLINLPFIHSFELPYCQGHVMKVPSILASLKLLYNEEVDEIHVSTLGPVGLFGLLVARLLNVRIVGVYDTDYHQVIRDSIEAESIAGIFESYTRWFYSQMDALKVPGEEYLNVFENRGIERTRITVFSCNAEEWDFDAPGSSLPGAVGV